MYILNIVLFLKFIIFYNYYVINFEKIIFLNFLSQIKFTVIDHFSKFIKSYAIKENTAENALLCIKDYCNFIGFPKIIQSDNGLEYKNALFKEFCIKNNIIQIFSSPRHPQTNGVIEICHKETRKYILEKIANEQNETDLLNVLIDANHIHNYNTHSVTKYRPVDLINNTNEEVFKELIANITKKYNKKNLEYTIIKKGTKLRLKPGCYKSGRSIKFRKNKNKIISIPATVIKDFDCGLLYVNIDASYYEFKENEEYYVDSSLVVVLNNNQWNVIVNLCNKHYEDESINNEIIEESDTNNINKKKKKIKNKKYRKTK